MFFTLKQQQTSAFTSAFFPYNNINWTDAYFSIFFFFLTKNGIIPLQKGKLFRLNETECKTKKFKKPKKLETKLKLKLENRKETENV